MKTHNVKGLRFLIELITSSITIILIFTPDPRWRITPELLRSVFVEDVTQTGLYTTRVFHLLLQVIFVIIVIRIVCQVITR